MVEQRIALNICVYSFPSTVPCCITRSVGGLTFPATRVEKNQLCHPRACGAFPETRVDNNSDDDGGNVCRALRRPLPPTPQHCTQRSASPVRRMFFKRASQRVSWLDFAAGARRYRTFAPLALPPPTSLTPPPSSISPSSTSGQATKSDSSPTNPPDKQLCFPAADGDSPALCLICADLPVCLPSFRSSVCG